MKKCEYPILREICDFFNVINFFAKQNSSYVDPHRMVSVKFGSGQDDLKNIISKKGRRQHNADEKLPPGEPCLEMYLKLSDSFMRKGRFDVALYHIGEAADFNPESPVKQAFAGTELL